MKPEHVAISERIAKHLETQKAQSINPLYGCAYRGREGAMCAVGCLMTDEAYNEARKSTRAEGATAASVIVHDILSASGIEATKELVYEVLMPWQGYHDGLSGGPRYEDWLEAPDLYLSPSEFHESLLS